MPGVDRVQPLPHRVFQGLSRPRAQCLQRWRTWKAGGRQVLGGLDGEAFGHDRSAQGVRTVARALRPGSRCTDRVCAPDAFPMPEIRQIRPSASIRRTSCLKCRRGPVAGGIRNPAVSMRTASLHLCGSARPRAAGNQQNLARLVHISPISRQFRNKLWYMGRRDRDCRIGTRAGHDGVDPGCQS